MLGHDKAATVIKRQVHVAEQLSGAHITVEIGIAKTDRAFFLAVKLLLQLIAARGAEADQAIELAVGRKAQGAVAAGAFLDRLAELGRKDKAALLAAGE